MKHALWIALMAVALCGTAPRLGAAGPPSAHVPALARGQLPFFPQSREAPPPSRRYAKVPFDGDLEMSLKARLAQIRNLHDLIEELQKHPELFDPKKIANGDWKDPKFLEKQGPKLLEMFKGMGLVDAEGEGGLKLNKDKLTDLKADLKKQFENWKEGEAGPDQIPDQNPFPDPNGKPFQGKPLDLGGGQPLEMPAGEPDEQAKMADFFKDWMLKMEDSKFGDLFRNSPAFQEGIKDLTDSIQKGQALTWKPGDGFADNLAKWGNPGEFNWFKNAWTGMNNLSLPNLRPPGMGVPKIGGWGANIPAPVPGPWAGAPAAGGAGIGMVVLWVGVGVVVLILLWKFLPQLKLAAQGQARAGWRLGPWPVDPRRIATRAEVVKAFEFLSLLRFGLDVRTWNHRDIAVALGAAGGDRQAAEDLAGAYELARYTPDNERLPEARLAAARRDLCFLAGMS